MTLHCASQQNPALDAMNADNCLLYTFAYPYVNSTVESRTQFFLLLIGIVEAQASLKVPYREPQEDGFYNCYTCSVIAREDLWSSDDFLSCARECVLSNWGFGTRTLHWFIRVWCYVRFRYLSNTRYLIEHIDRCNIPGQSRDSTWRFDHMELMTKEVKAGSADEHEHSWPRKTVYCKRRSSSVAVDRIVLRDAYSRAELPECAKVDLHPQYLGPNTQTPDDWIGIDLHLSWCLCRHEHKNKPRTSSTVTVRIIVLSLPASTLEQNDRSRLTVRHSTDNEQNNRRQIGRQAVRINFNIALKNGDYFELSGAFEIQRFVSSLRARVRKFIARYTVTHRYTGRVATGAGQGGVACWYTPLSDLDLFFCTSRDLYPLFRFRFRCRIHVCRQGPHPVLQYRTSDELTNDADRAMNTTGGRICVPTTTAVNTNAYS
ncbi:hypothetical protein CLF_111175 [Clonorchis sinensis]|uniref:Uncharacterized protein n=1 Tax=Clonorchis sinensis TaxID=79923 RepID=G7YLG7_CLOSI|nr:hypothetical protein CLF_111175 [Clonorchis sinensis]